MEESDDNVEKKHYKLTIGMIILEGGVMLQTYENPIRVGARISAEAENSVRLCMGRRNLLGIITEHDGTRRIKRQCLSMKEELRNSRILSNQ